MKKAGLLLIGLLIACIAVYAVPKDVKDVPKVEFQKMFKHDAAAVAVEVQVAQEHAVYNLLRERAYELPERDIEKKITYWPESPDQPLYQSGFTDIRRHYGGKVIPKLSC